MLSRIGYSIRENRIAIFGRDAFLELLEKQPKIAINMLAVFARHLRRFARLIEDLSLKEVPGRLAAYLLYLNARSEHPNHIELDITKTQPHWERAGFVERLMVRSSD